MRIMTLSLFCLLWLASPLAGDELERPFIWMNRDDIAKARQQLHEPWAEPALQWAFDTHRGGTQMQGLRRMFDYMVMQDQAAGETEKQYLLTFIGQPVNYRPWSDQYINALRYDVLHDLLTEPERQQLQETFRSHIQHALDTQRSWDRINWLPNMQWPRKFSAHLLALSLADRELIEAVADSSGGWKWYLDGYVADGGFYMEEFGKQYSMVGAMLLWCRGLARLGMDELGFGYTGKGGGTMRNYLDSLIWIGWPRVEIPGGMPNYPRITHGDARGGLRWSIQSGEYPSTAFEQSNVNGYFPNGVGGNRTFMAANMNGRDHRDRLVDKMLKPLWFEIAHRQWPDGNYDYFLAQMRRSGDEKYYPSLMFGLDPIDPATVQPPPAKSLVARERGFAMLRAVHGPEYWESPAPAAALQMAMYYVHFTQDAFSLLGLYAFNRPLYVNRQISAGYGGDCPWSDSVHGHAGVVVDKDRARSVDSGNEGAKNVRIREALDGIARFVAIRAAEVYPAVDQERALLLTPEYLFDVFHIVSDRPRLFHWNVHAIGLFDAAEQSGDWKPAPLPAAALYDFIQGEADPGERRLEQQKRVDENPERYELRDPLKHDAGAKAWSAHIVQRPNPHSAKERVLPDAWYERQVGVKVHMLGDQQTAIYAGRTPTSIRTSREQMPDGSRQNVTRQVSADETGGVTLIVERADVSATTFIALHEPFENNWARISTCRRFGQDGEVVAVRIAGEGVNDRVLIRLGEQGIGEPVTVEGDDGERFTFVDMAFVRIGRERVEVMGAVHELHVQVEGEPELIVNGAPAAAVIDRGVLRLDRNE
jgi:hypothetical protein